MTTRRPVLTAAGIVAALACVGACYGGSSAPQPSRSTAGSGQAVTVPDVTGKYVGDVERALCAEGLRPRIVEAPRIDHAGPNDNGYVVASLTPAVGSSVPTGATIDLTLGTSMNAGGPFPDPPATAAVPSVTDNDVDGAISLLTGTGFSVDVTAKTPADGLVVVSQSPGAGSTLDTKTPVTLVAGSPTGGACS